MGYLLEARSPVKLWRFAEERHSRLVLALDFVDGQAVDEGSKRFLNKCFRLLDSLREYIVGVKIGFPLLLSTDTNGVRELIDVFGKELYFLSDFKIGDVPEVVNYTLKLLGDLGFDGATIHLFQGGLRRISVKSIDLFGVLLMSHPEALLFERNLEELINQSSAPLIDGVVVGATRKEYLQEVRRKLPAKTILCPGIITQGAQPGQALKFGGDFEIVGRAITMSPDPVSSVKMILEAERNVFER